MSTYTYVSDVILADLLSAKSRVTDLKVYVDEHSKVLKDLNMLDDINAILYSAAYREEEV